MEDDFYEQRLQDSGFELIGGEKYRYMLQFLEVIAHIYGPYVETVARFEDDNRAIPLRTDPIYLIDSVRPIESAIKRLYDYINSRPEISLKEYKVYDTGIWCFYIARNDDSPTPDNPLDDYKDQFGHQVSEHWVDRHDFAGNDFIKDFNQAFGLEL